MRLFATPTPYSKNKMNNQRKYASVAETHTSKTSNL